ncbi:MAG: beta-propeller domain-containing protein [Pseudomonadota bacterium]
MKRLLFALLTLPLLSACDTPRTQPKDLGDIQLRKFGSCAEIQKARTMVLRPVSEGVAYGAPSDTSGSKSNASAPLGETNIQVAGVDELDIAKADGEFIFRTGTAYGTNQIEVLKRSPASSAAIVQKIDLGNLTVLGLFLTPDKLIAITEDFTYGSPPLTGLLSVAAPVPEQSRQSIHILFFARSSDGTLSKTDERTISGQVQTARLIGNRMHLVLTQYLGWIYPDEPTPEPLSLPAIGVAKSTETKFACNCDGIWYEPIAGDPSNFEYPIIDSLLGVLTLNIDDPDSDPQGEWIAGASASVIYASENNLFLASGGWSDTLPIHQFQLGTADRKTQYVGSALVEGTLINQFAMDENKGHLRVATTFHGEENFARGVYGTSQSEVSVFRLGKGNLERVGQVAGLGKGETIYAVRFLGDVGYVVTFKKVDPLYVVDLKDPTNPVVRGELKIPGYSSYLHPMKEGYLLAVGKDAEAALESDDFAWYQGMAMSIFDVRDLDNPKLVQKIGIGSRGTNSEALYDHKAFRYIPEKNLVVLPIDLYEDSIGQWNYGTWTFSGFQIYSATVESGFSLVGKSAFKSQYGFSTWGFSGGGNRSFYKDGVMSLIGGGEMVLRSADAPDVDLARLAID